MNNFEYPDALGLSNFTYSQRLTNIISDGESFDKVVSTLLRMGYKVSSELVKMFWDGNKKKLLTPSEQLSIHTGFIVLTYNDIVVVLDKPNGFFAFLGTISNKETIRNEVNKLMDMANVQNPYLLPPPPAVKKGNIYLMLEANGELDLMPFKLTVPETPVEVCYNRKVLNEFSSLVDRLHNDRPGIHLFHGKPGTGKTTLIRHLTKEVNKKFIFVPNNFGRIITSPDFLPFFMGYAESILVMEDAETMIKERNLEGNHDAISNILNITDGLLGDVLRPQIIFTFNCDLQKIDTAITRPGRCATNIEFDALEAERATELAKFLKLNKKFDKPATLAEVTCL